MFFRRLRPMLEERFYETHSGARQTALWTAKEYPEVEIVMIQSVYIPNSTNLEFEKTEAPLSRKEIIDFLESEQYSENEIYKLIAEL